MLQVVSQHLEISHLCYTCVSTLERKELTQGLTQGGFLETQRLLLITWCNLIN